MNRNTPCSCRNPQPGCGCFPFCHRKTAVAISLCNAHRAANPRCKSGSYICDPCYSVPHSDHAEYYVCRA